MAKKKVVEKPKKQKQGDEAYDWDEIRTWLKSAGNFSTDAVDDLWSYCCDTSDVHNGGFFWIRTDINDVDEDEYPDLKKVLEFIEKELENDPHVYASW